MSLSLFLLSAGSCCWAYAAWETARTVLGRLESRRREVQVRTLLEGRGPEGRNRSASGKLEGAARFWESNFTTLLSHPRLLAYGRWLERMLARSNLRVRFTPGRFLSFQFLTGCLAAFLFGGLAGDPWVAGVCFALGAAAPWAWLNDEALRRERRVLGELPNALEMFSLSVEAGLTLDQAWSHYLQNARPGPWKEELSQVVQETRAGAARREALAGLSERLQLTDISLFVSSVTHAERAGTGVGATLRRLAATLRDKQSQRAEKAVQELPVKLLLPLLLCIMPVTLLVLFAPVILRLIYG